MTMQTALAVLAILAGPDHAWDVVAPDPVLAEMAPAPGRWEAEDAPAYFSDRLEFRDGAAPERVSVRAPVADRRP